MADIKISQLASEIHLSATDVTPIVSNGVTKKTTMQAIKDFTIGTEDNSELGADVSTQINTLNQIAESKADADDVESEIQTLTNKLNDEIETRAKVSAHNWFGGKFTSQTLNNIVFNALSDGTVTASGTASATASTIASSSWVLKAGTYILSSNPLPAGTGKYTYISLVKKSDISTFAAAERTESTLFTLSEDTEIFARVSCQGNGETFDVVFKPMIRLATDSDATYQPYAKTNRELTEENEALANLVDCNACTSLDDIKNLIDLPSKKAIYGEGKIGNLSTSALKTLLGVPFTANYINVSIEKLPLTGMPMYKFTATNAVTGGNVCVKYGVRVSGNDVFTEWIFVDELTVASDTTTLFKYHKVNGIVTMQLVGQQTYADIKNLTIPSGFRPNSAVTALAYCASGTSRYLATFNLNPNGTIGIGKIANNAYTTPSDTDGFEFSTCYYAGN